MANLLKFFRSATMPSVAEQNASIGSIWFDTTNNVIKVRTAENGVDADWEVYGTSPADLTAAIGRIATLEGAVKTLNVTDICHHVLHGFLALKAPILSTDKLSNNGLASGHDLIGC